jgi:hypothetical protein
MDIVIEIRRVGREMMGDRFNVRRGLKDAF